MTYYFYDFSFRLLLLKLKGNKVHLFKRNTAVQLFLTVLKRLPIIGTKLDKIAHEPDVQIGDYKGLYYRLNKEAQECTEFIYDKLGLEDCQFIRVYNKKFKTNKFKPFVSKWVSVYVFELLSCLYRVHLDKPAEKILYLSSNPLNRLIYEWEHQKTRNKIPVKWLKESDLRAGLETLAFLPASFIYRLLSRGFCRPVKPERFKILKEAVWGFRNPVFRDDFILDNDKLLRKDVLLYTHGSKHEAREMAYREAQDIGYECLNINKPKIPLNLLFSRLVKYHLLLPLFFMLRNLISKHNYIFREWLTTFHKVAANYEILLSHYDIGLELSTNEAGLAHIPETIILNNYGAKSVIYHWSDLTCYDSMVDQFKSFNIYLTWGKAHSQGQKNFVDSIIETGCWLKHNFEQSTKNKKSIYEKLGLPINGARVLAFYDESFHPEIHFTEEVLLDFWQMMFALIEANVNVIGIVKPKYGDQLKRRILSDKGKEIYNNIKQRCSENGRFYFIDNPRDVAVTEVIAISDINITMGMGSPSTIALLCGKIGLYYDTTGSDYHPFTQKYINKLVYDNKRDLFSAVNRIINGTYNPLSEIDEELLRDYDQFRDERGLERFRETLLKNI